MDLRKTIKINDHFEISYGMILMTSLVTFFECMGMIAFNNWQFTPAVFFMISNTILLLRRRGEDMEEFEERLKVIEEKLKEKEDE